MEKLKEGEVLCPHCKGSGFKYPPGNPKDPNYDSSDDYYSPRCTKCWGAGKLDWIDLIIGKRDPYWENQQVKYLDLKRNIKRKEK